MEADSSKETLQRESRVERKKRKGRWVGKGSVYRNTQSLRGLNQFHFESSCSCHMELNQRNNLSDMSTGRLWGVMIKYGIMVA